MQLQKGEKDGRERASKRRSRRVRVGKVMGGERRRTAKELKRISNCHCQGGDDDDARQAEGGGRQRDRQTTGQGNVQLLAPCSRVPPWRLEAANAGVAVDVEWHLVSGSPAWASSPALKSQHEHFLLSTSWTAAPSPSWVASSSSSASLCLCLVGNSRRGREVVEEKLLLHATSKWNC